MSNRDHLSNEVSVDVQLNEKGLSAKTQSRAVAAIDRLIGSLIDVPAAKLEASANRIRAEGTRDIVVIDVETALVRGALESDTAIHQCVINAIVASKVPLLANKVAVVQRAIEHLPAADDESEPASSDSRDDDELDDIWLNNLDGYAEKASSEVVRDIWGRVLAGEIRQPGSFSLTTLRLLSELDQEMATTFERETTCRLKNGYIIKPPDDELQNERLAALLFLEEVGLFHSAQTGVTQTKTSNSEGDVVWREEQFLLLAKCQANTGVSLGLVPLTRVGREICRILPPTDPIAVLEQIGEKVAGQVQSMELVQVVATVDNQTTFTHIRTIKEEQ